MSNRFYFGNSDDSGSDLDDNVSSLPFPKPLDRAAFLVDDFDPAVFLSNLSNRFQTLEDLQTELRELSQSLNKELVDLVNDNYQDFLSLGSTLSGGEERVEDIRVGLLGFQRDVQSVRDKVDTRRKEISDLLQQKRGVKQDIAIGRALLEIAEHLDELENRLDLVQSKQPAKDSVKAEESETPWSDEWIMTTTSDSDDDDDDDDEQEESQIPSKLLRTVDKFLIVKLLISKMDSQHPFLVASRDRIRRIQDTIALDLGTAGKSGINTKDQQRLLDLRKLIEGG